MKVGIKMYFLFVMVFFWKMCGNGLVWVVIFISLLRRFLVFVNRIILKSFVLMRMGWVLVFVVMYVLLMNCVMLCVDC